MNKVSTSWWSVLLMSSIDMTNDELTPGGSEV